MPELRTYPEGVPCWIDVEQPDLEAAQAFYSGLFDWTFRDAGPGGAAAPYVVAELDGQPVAGLAAASNPSPPTWNTYVAVDDIDRVARKVRTAGGQVLAGPDAAGDLGQYAACTDLRDLPFGLWHRGTLPGAQVVNTPGAWNFSDLHTADPPGSAAFYASVFGWLFDDVGFGSMIRRPGYGDHLAATIDPGIHRRQIEVNAPPGFADAVGWLAVAEDEEAPHWHVTFTVADRDAVAEAAERLGATVVRRDDTEWTRDVEIRDPQGAVFTASQFTPPDG